MTEVQRLLKAMDDETDMAERDEKIDALIAAVGKLGITVRELKARVNFLEGQSVDTDKARQAEDYFLADMPLEEVIR